MDIYREDPRMTIICNKIDKYVKIIEFLDKSRIRISEKIDFLEEEKDMIINDKPIINNTKQEQELLERSTYGYAQ